MKIHHIAIWVRDLEKMKSFYERYFGGLSGHKYHNPLKNFQSYFIKLDAGAQIELMHKPGIVRYDNEPAEAVQGIAHIAISVGSREKVDALTRQLQNDGYRVISEPRLTGDNYYESVVCDPEFNKIEIAE
jgi:lactoylglutathione lyase